MKLIRPKFQILEQPPTENGIFQQIEMAGRTCYKSEQNITDTSAHIFVEKMVNSAHFAMLEHGTFYLKMHKTSEKWHFLTQNMQLLRRFFAFSRFNVVDDEIFCTTNARLWHEYSLSDHLSEALCDRTAQHEARVTVKLVCDRGVANEFVRHRAFSFAQESTRFCNYTKDKFGNQLSFVIPCWIEDLEEGEYQSLGDYSTESVANRAFFSACLEAEKRYLAMAEAGWKAEQLRNILPLALKTELVMTGFQADWADFFQQRAKDSTGRAHPQAKELAIPLMEKMLSKNLLK